VELVTFKCEVSTGQFICVKPEPKKQVAREEKKSLAGRKLYISLHSGLRYGVRAPGFPEIWMVGVCAWTGGLLCKRSSENAQRELRDCVSASLYADHARETFLGLRK
jgi:hypothetical protein